MHFTVEFGFCFDCRNVQHCIGCWNLRNKEHCIFNQPASEEEVKKLRAQFASRTFYDDFKEEFRKRKIENAIHKSMSGTNNENCTGDFVSDSKNAKFCFVAFNVQDVSYAGRVVEQKDCADVESIGKGELVYESMSADFSYGCVTCATVEHLRNCFCCDLCFHCTDCFGCVSVRNKQYCILNKQYSKEEYQELVPKIIERMRKYEEWAEFFPIALSPFCYNETLAQEHYPLTKEQVQSRGWKWKDAHAKKNLPQTYVIPNSIQQVTDTIVNELLACRTCRKNYKIIPQELQFYREQSLPIPQFCPECRHLARVAMHNPRELWTRNCAKCGAEIQTSYSPDRLEIVYCESCYLQSIY